MQHTEVYQNISVRCTVSPFWECLLVYKNNETEKRCMFSEHAVLPELIVLSCKILFPCVIYILPWCYYRVCRKTCYDWKEQCCRRPMTKTDVCHTRTWESTILNIILECVGKVPNYTVFCPTLARWQFPLSYTSPSCSQTRPRIKPNETNDQSGLCNLALEPAGSVLVPWNCE